MLPEALFKKDDYYSNDNHFKVHQCNRIDADTSHVSAQGVFPKQFVSNQPRPDSRERHRVVGISHFKLE